MLRFRPVFSLQNMTHLLFSALTDDRKLNSKTLMTAPLVVIPQITKISETMCVHIMGYVCESQK
jgi:hypothetical protein